MWRRSRDLVEIDITYTCNLKCFNCNRSCEQDPSSDRMSAAQVQRFLDESRDKGVRWRRIRLLGGEPTTHPQFLEIVSLVARYRDRFAPGTRIEVATNGHGPHVKKMLAALPDDIQVLSTSKTSNVQTAFHTFNIAPLDLPEYADAEFANGCGVVQMCGFGVTPYGYYPCAVAGAIDRSFGLNLGRQTLPDSRDEMKEELRAFCSRCGLFKRPQRETLQGPAMSPLWREAYAKSLRAPAQLTRLPAEDLVQITPVKHVQQPCPSGSQRIEKVSQ
ncbi:MAG: radical SAM protein [Acidobacteriales bacterium]|nr:radical SAM protein [Terriglobales bacterium]